MASIARIYCAFIARPPQQTSRRDPGGPAGSRADVRRAHFTSWMRLISAACCAPYLSHTGFTASWNGFLSSILMISTPASFMLLDRLLLHLVPELALLLLRLLGDLHDQVLVFLGQRLQVLFENTRISGIIRWPVIEKYLA